MRPGGGGFGGPKMDLSDHSKRSKKNDKETIKRLIKYVKEYWYILLIALILTVATTIALIYRPLIIQKGIDDYMAPAYNGLIAESEGIGGIRSLSIIFLVLLLGEFILSYIQRYLLEFMSKNIIMKIRSEVFESIQQLPLKFFDKNSSGSLVTRVTNDTESINEMFTNVIVGLIKSIITVVGIVIIMFKLDIKITLLVMLILPLMAIATVLFRKKVRKIFKDIRMKLSKINGFMAEHLSGMHIIQLFNMQIKKQKEFEKINKEYYKSTNQQILMFGLFRPLMDVIKNVAIIILLYYTGNKVLEGTLEIGIIYAFYTYINRLFQPIMELTENYNMLQSSIVSSQRIFAIIDEAKEKQPKGNGEKLENVTGKIEFKNVWFAYNNEEWVLKNVSFTINPGESIAFVGPTGAGKTSIINLICGFYEHQKGDIYIDGINIRNIRKQELRKNIGLVLQDVFLFAGNILNNIRLLNKNISEEDVKRAAEFVNAHNFINEYEEGYYHQINEKGTTLSAGQRQLLSFARAITTNPKILVLDEATSKIDTETENLIQKALVKIMKNRTTISIAHRLSTIQKADKIIVIHNGTIEEEGKHHQLLDNMGLYYDLYKLQYA